MKLLEALTKTIITELSANIKQKMVDKFQKETDDSPEVIMDLLTKFEKVQNSLDIDKRDITKYKYNDLKTSVSDITASLSAKKNDYSAKNIFSYFKNLNKNINDTDVKLYIKKYLEIRSELPKEINDVYKYRNYEELVKIIDSNYAKLLIPKMITKFMAEDGFINRESIKSYIESYIENFNDIPVTTKPITNLSFIELEHLLDQIQGSQKQFTDKTTMDNVPVIYDKNGLIIWEPRNKEECISLRQGRPWCTSQDGARNLYYSYRYGSNNLTIYYVTDKELPFDDTNYASVILVDRDGNMRLADKYNANPYHGSTIHPWSTIISKIPKLEGLKHLLKWRPLSDKEIAVFQRYNGLSPNRVGDSPLEYFNGDTETLDLWMEINSPALSDIQYKNLPVESKKKWIGLNLPISPGKVTDSEPEAYAYILAKNREGIIGKKLSELTETDMMIINSGEGVYIKKLLKERFISEVNLKNHSSTTLNIEYPGNDIGKFIYLYGLENLIQVMPDNLISFSFINNSNESKITLDVSRLLGKFKYLQNITLNNCIDKLPEKICRLVNLSTITIQNNKYLTKIPDCLCKDKIIPKDPNEEPIPLAHIRMINATGSDNIKLTDEFKNSFMDMGALVFFNKIKKPQVKI